MGAMSHVVNTLEYMVLKNKKKPIEIRLNSPGGSVVDGLAIYDVIVQTKQIVPVNITVNGACMSMGTIILQAASERLSYRNSQFLLHEIRYGGFDTHSGQKDHQKQADRLQEILNGILVERSKLSLKALRTLIERRDYTMSAKEALQHGLIDRIVE